MRTRNAYRVAVPTRDDPEEVGALQHRNTACLSGDKLGVIGHYRGSMDDEVGTLDVLGALTDENGNAHFTYSVKRLGLVVVRAREVVALSVEYLREGVHTRAADTDEVYMFFSVKNIEDRIIQLRSPFH